MNGVGTLGALTLLVSALAQQPVSRRPVIVIDPGHPSEVSSGAELQNGTTEVHSAWIVAQRLERLLEDRGYRVVLTKARERQMVRNVARAEVGNRVRAALVVRLHCDASTDSGYAVYHPDRAGTAEGRTGPSDEIMRASQAAAESLHVAMARRLTGKLIRATLDSSEARMDARSWPGLLPTASIGFWVVRGRQLGDVGALHVGGAHGPAERLLTGLRAERPANGDAAACIRDGARGGHDARFDRQHHARVGDGITVDVRDDREQSPDLRQRAFLVRGRVVEGEVRRGARGRAGRDLDQLLDPIHMDREGVVAG
jgi:hypothetical protein